MRKLYFQPGLDSSGVFLNRGLWALQILLSVVFLLAGSGKLAGAEPMVATFERIGLGQWFRVLTGGLEILAAVLLLIPRPAGVGALLLAVTMLGAVLTHLFVIGGSPVAAFILMILAVFVVWGRWTN